MRITKRFSWHAKSGDFAEKYLIKKYFPSLGLGFRKIREDMKGTKPDGWILRGKERVALAEIKLIQYHPKSEAAHTGVVKITIDKPIQDAISRAKKQLKSAVTELPKILFLILDDHFANSRSVLDAAFGPWITVEQAGKIVYNGPRGFHPKKSVNKIIKFWEIGYLQCSVISQILRDISYCYLDHKIHPNYLMNFCQLKLSKKYGNIPKIL